MSSKPTVQSPPLNSSASDTFAFCAIDFDDTLIPTRIWKLFAQSLSIDIFQLFSKSKLLKLQRTIIDCIGNIQKQYINKGQNIYFSVVSNATQKWLDYTFKGSKTENIAAPFALLDKYFVKNGISVVCASSMAYEFVQQRFGDKADEMFEHTLHAENKDNKYMWKYTAFSSMIRSLHRKTGKRCIEVISIGDGKDEEKALKLYSKTHKMKSLHIRLLRGPTINQITNQWIYLKHHLVQINGKQIYNNYQLFSVDDLSKVFVLNSDNNRYCTGNKHQLPAIEQYFNHWMNHSVSGLDAEEKEIVFENVCKAIHKRLFSLNPESESSRYLKLILIKALCKNKDFNNCFNVYYRRIQKYSINCIN